MAWCNVFSLWRWASNFRSFGSLTAMDYTYTLKDGSRRTENIVRVPDIGFIIFSREIQNAVLNDESDGLDKDLSNKAQQTAQESKNLIKMIEDIGPEVFLDNED